MAGTLTKSIGTRVISGARDCDQRPGLDGLMRGVAWEEFDLEAAWSFDSLGRSLQSLVGLLGESHMPSVSTCTCISRASTRPHRRESVIRQAILTPVLPHLRMLPGGPP